MTDTDLINKQFGRLTVIDKGKQVTHQVTKKDKTYTYIRQYYLCQCECGNQKEIRKDQLTSKKRPTKSCGCITIENIKQLGVESALNLKGLVVGRLTVIKRNGYTKNTKEKRVQWLCQCICGNQVNVVASKLNTGYTKSCGCLNKDKAQEMGRQHGGKYGGLTKSDWAKLTYVDNTNLHHISNINNNLQKNNKTGIRGVSYNKDLNRWIARITFQKQNHYLGSFDNPKDAAKARKDAEVILYDPIIQKHDSKIAKLKDLRNKTNT